MKLRAFRAVANLTQQELAKKLGISELSVIKYESGSTIPSKETMLMIYEFSDGMVTPNDFFDLETIRTRQPDATPPETTYVAAGLMSGTSMDGIDASLIITDGERFVKEVGSTSMRYDPEFKMLLKGCERAVWSSEGDLQKARQNYARLSKEYFVQSQNILPEQADKLFADLCKYFGKHAEEVTFDEVIHRSTELHATIVAKLLEVTEYKANKIDVVGYHGQTVFHRPSAGVTLQLGDGEHLASKSGITTVYDFRANDVRHGGQGAPFAPLYHRALANQLGLTPVVIANCGGISNITIIDTAEENLFAYDCGPGNSLIDRFVQLRVGRSMDTDGAFGLQGQVIPKVLEALHANAVKLPDGRNYLEKLPPKSLDVNDLKLIAELDPLTLQDGCATLAAFTADCIVRSLDLLKFEIPKLWVVAGGGWKNPVILNELTARLRAKLGNALRVQHAEQVGWDGTALEAQIFAYLAVRSLRGLPLSVPGTTGVPSPSTGGRTALPDGDSKKATKKVRDLLAQD